MTDGQEQAGEESSELLAVKGVRLAAVESHIRYRNRPDLVVIELAENTEVASVFTRNAFCAAPVILARQHLALNKGKVRYLLTNTGNANAGTGEQGLQDAHACCAALAELTGVPESAVLPFSTGVIGEPLPVDRLVAGLPAALANLAADNWASAAQGIMTTDTRPKARSRRLVLDDSNPEQEITLTGICKGAGMIRPDMATMLCYVATDARIALADLQALLQEAVSHSFNRITVDGDTSTNDCCVLAATGASGIVVRQSDHTRYARFAAALNALVLELAKDIIRDAEGAGKFVTVQVLEGRDSEECLRVAYAIAESPLVKTALAASDPNWGRILAAIGRAGLAELDVNRVTLMLGEVVIAENGMRATGYTEAAGQQLMNEDKITITVKLARGKARETVWTSDLTEEYVRINASYRS
ncbi:MAG: bifunctional glutamate N-acetyltransferase/amino-acid acetyltransferase ArgJ [Pseudomonadales bacterium]|nr:bifunctional glutamate N-acetyltransferase/amino-acid acetyltransferase ArgJ [Pseudomonadales bacterium]